jgi:asparagine synthase (glutamine-hydrolysing)
MCGIGGFIGEGDPAALEAMSAALAHRGPDAKGFLIDAEHRVHLAHRRLAIVDVADGAQPMRNEDGKVVIVFNGEIYNHTALRKELEARGHQFRTRGSDTEVLIHGYEEWGAGLLERLNGMFAFAICDFRRNRLFLARDRFGEKPLYFCQSRGLFAFASEIRALQSHPRVDRGLDTLGLAKFFAYGYVPAPGTIYRMVRKLPAAHYLDVAFDEASSGAQLQCRPYWRFTLAPDDSMSSRTEKDVAEELRTLLTEAVARRLMSEVPLGVFLSGGIDSSAVVALLARQMPADRIRTFTIGFDERSFDESPYAARVATEVGTTHSMQMLTMDAARGELGSILARIDEPFADPSLLPTYLLCRFARQSVTVALTGDGGDELFAGYDPFDALAPARFYENAVPTGLHLLIRSMADRLPSSNRNMSLDFKLKRTLMGLSYEESVRVPVWMSPLTPEQVSALMGRTYSAEELYSEAVALWQSDSCLDLVDRALNFFTRFYLQEDILLKADRASMMCSLESRAVFLDNDLVAFCERLPNRLKYRRGQRKYLLKKALRGHLPDAVLDRPKKGFGIPLAKWLRELPSPRITDVPGLDRAFIESLWDEHRKGLVDHRIALWSCLSLQGALGEQICL